VAKVRGSPPRDVTTRERMRLLWFSAAEAQQYVEDAQACIATIREIAEEAQVKRLEEAVKLLEEARERLSQAKRLLTMARDMIEEDLLG